jgi:hypothetical protein
MLPIKEIARSLQKKPDIVEVEFVIVPWILRF